VEEAQRIRVLIAKPGLDGHDRGAKVLVKGLMQAGMEVIYTGRHQRMANIVATARDEDVDVIGLSILSGTHVDYCKKLLAELEAAGVSDVLLLVGGTVSGASATAVKELGFKVFPVGSTLPEIVDAIRAGVSERRGQGDEPGSP
jgi:methylmalonyl-CoA mutase C-terminal domain/subunit